MKSIGKEISNNLRGRRLSIEDYEIILQTLEACKPQSEDEQRREDVNRLKTTSTTIIKQITEIQEKCPHTAANKKARANTGNPYNKDEYWYEYTCPVCDKKWTEDQ